MNLAAAITALEEELTRQRAEGIDRISLAPNRIAQLHDPDDQAAPDRSANPVATSREETRKPQVPVAPKETAPAKPSPDKSSADSLPEAPSFDLPEGDALSRWAWLREKVLGCPVCNGQLNPGGKVVFGEGAVDADLFFCGEAPGAEEEIEGRPFVGPAGQLLDKMIAAMGLQREQVYIGNIVNWRPRHGKAYGNRPPNPDEIRYCLPYLIGQLEVVRPRIIVALGATAATALLGESERVRMGSVRGKWKTFEGIPMMITYHPSFLLHNGTPERKREVWEDLLEVMEKLGLPISEKQRGYFQ